MTNFIIAQIIGFLTIISTGFALLSKEKHRAMIWFLITNIGLLSTYFLLGRVLGSALAGLACVQNIVFFIYAKKQLKPSALVLIILIASYIGISFIIGISLLDILMLVALILITVFNWQDKMQVLRGGTILTALLFIAYNALIGAYLRIGGEVLTIVVAVVGLCKYKNLKQTKKK